MHFNPEANAKLFLVIIDWGCINVYYAVLSTSVMSPLTMLTDTKKHPMTLIEKIRFVDATGSQKMPHK